MLLQVYNLMGKDKQVEHPAFGVLSCSGIQDSHKKCIELTNTNSVLEIQCRTLYELSTQRFNQIPSNSFFMKNCLGFQCYKAKSDGEFKKWIDNEIDEKKRLYKVFFF